MKKLLLSIIFLCSVATLSAQYKGDIYVGGRVGVSTASVFVEKYKETSVGFGIAPEFGYFALNNFRVGASLGYNMENKTHTFEVMPNIAYYVEICDEFYYTPEIELGLSISINDNVAIPGMGIGLSLGSFEFRPTPRFGMSVNLLSLSYAVYSYEDHDNNIGINTHGVDFQLGISPSVGVKYYF